MNSIPQILHASKCCLLVIDPQEKLMNVIHKAEKVVKNSVLMIRLAQTVEMPILATTQYKKGLGPFVQEINELIPDVPCVDKMEFNSFLNYEFRKALGDLPASVDTLLMTGVEAHICIYQTALGALQCGYKPWVIADAISSRDKKNHKLALQRLLAMGIAVGPAEMALYEILARADSKEFKAMRQFLK